MNGGKCPSMREEYVTCLKDRDRQYLAFQKREDELKAEVRKAKARAERAEMELRALRGSQILFIPCGHCGVVCGSTDGFCDACHTSCTGTSVSRKETT